MIKLSSVLHEFFLHLLQFLIQLSRLFQLHGQILVAVLETPIESDGKRAEGDDDEGFEEIDNRKQIALHAVTHGKMAIETDAQCHERRVDYLESDVAADDIFDTFLERPGQLDDILQDDVGHHACEKAYHP